MAWYRTGTCSVTNGSTAVTGAGTAWIANAAAGESFLGPDGKLYEIASIQSDTALTLASAYLGATQATQAYVIVPTQSYLRDLAAQAAALVNSYSSFLNGVGAGKFSDGTVGAPGVRFANDDDTGLYRIAANNVGLAIGGVKLLDFSAGLVGVFGTSNGATIEVAALRNEGTGANTKARLGFFAAGTRYAGISGGYGAAAPELSFDIQGTTVATVSAALLALTGALTVSGTATAATVRATSFLGIEESSGNKVCQVATSSLAQGLGLWAGGAPYLYSTGTLTVSVGATLAAGSYPSAKTDVLAISTAGLAVTGTLSATGVVSAGDRIGLAGNAPASGGLGASTVVLGSDTTNGYKWLQSYGAPLWLNPVGNDLKLGLVSGTTPIAALSAVGGLAVNGTLSATGDATVGGGSGPRVLSVATSDSGGVNARVVATGSAVQFGTPNGVQLEWHVAGAAKAIVDTNGNLLVGVSSGSFHTISKASALGTNLLSISSSTTGQASATFAAVDTTGASGAFAALYLNKASTSSRSINAAGTINASGADMAENEHKAVLWLAYQFLKGEIVGFNDAGELTPRFDEARTGFGIKSTNPHVVGGDTWGSEDKVGKRPDEPVYQAPDYSGPQKPEAPAALVLPTFDQAEPQLRAVTIPAEPMAPDEPARADGEGDGDLAWARRVNAFVLAEQRHQQAVAQREAAFADDEAAERELAAALVAYQAKRQAHTALVAQMQAEHTAKVVEYQWQLTDYEQAQAAHAATVAEAETAHAAAMAQYRQALAAFEQRLDAARQTIDRIAYSGKCPVRVYDAQPGDYIIAERAADGSIKGMPVADPAPEKMRRAVGRVRRIVDAAQSAELAKASNNPDAAHFIGMAYVAVIVH